MNKYLQVENDRLSSLSSLPLPLSDNIALFKSTHPVMQIW